jgi:hypothetical protein
LSFEEMTRHPEVVGTLERIDQLRRITAARLAPVPSPVPASAPVSTGKGEA